MLSERSVVLDFEGFRHKKQNFILKEVAVCSEDCIDSFLLLPPTNLSSLSDSEQKSYHWLTKQLHGLCWAHGDYFYADLTRILQSYVLRYPKAVFYAKGLEKSVLFSHLLDRPVVDLDSIGCPKIEDIKCFKKDRACENHLPAQCVAQLRKHCAKEKALVYFNWLKHEQSRISETGSEFIKQFNTLRVDTSVGDSPYSNK